jgi:hypothetical protein
VLRAGDCLAGTGCVVVGNSIPFACQVDENMTLLPSPSSPQSARYGPRCLKQLTEPFECGDAVLHLDMQQ